MRKSIQLNQLAELVNAATLLAKYGINLSTEAPAKKHKTVASKVANNSKRSRAMKASWRRRRRENNA